MAKIPRRKAASLLILDLGKFGVDRREVAADAARTAGTAPQPSDAETLARIGSIVRKMAGGSR
jgi:hypothetical protein